MRCSLSSISSYHYHCCWYDAIVPNCAIIVDNDDWWDIDWSISSDW